MTSLAGAFVRGNKRDIELDLEARAVVHLREKVGKGNLGIGRSMCKGLRE